MHHGQFTTTHFGLALHETVPPTVITQLHCIIEIHEKPCQASCGGEVAVTHNCMARQATLFKPSSNPAAYARDMHARRPADC